VRSERTCTHTTLFQTFGGFLHSPTAQNYCLTGAIICETHITNIYLTGGFWPRVRARALRAPVFLGSLPCPSGRFAPPTCPSQLRCSPQNKRINYFQKQNVSIQAQTRAARGVYFSTGLSCTRLSYAAPY
jgi:hypothetical protein